MAAVLGAGGRRRCAFHRQGARRLPRGPRVPRRKRRHDAHRAARSAARGATPRRRAAVRPRRAGQRPLSHGSQSSNAAVLVEPDGAATLYTDFRYASRARALEGFEVVETARGLIPAVGELLAGRRIGFEEQHLPHARLSSAGRRRCRRGACQRARGVAARGEGRRGDRADASRRGALSDEVFAALAQERFTGRSERELAWWIERSFREGGAEGVSFEAVVASRRDGGVAARGPRRRADRAGRPRRRRRRLPRSTATARTARARSPSARSPSDCTSCTRSASKPSWRGSPPSRRASTVAMRTLRRGRSSRGAASAGRTGTGMGHGVGPPDPRGADAAARIDGRARGRETSSRSSRGSTSPTRVSGCASRTSCS